MTDVSLREQILRALRQAEELTLSELVEYTDRGYHACKRQVIQLENEGVIESQLGTEKHIWMSTDTGDDDIVEVHDNE
jgi:predicted transcriptional regulator